MNLTPQQLSAFLHLSRTGSFSEAALLQGVPQPSLSRTIERIERIVGRRLFDRTTRHVTLTSTGDELRPIAERLVSEFAGAYSELTRFIQGGRGRIRSPATRPCHGPCSRGGLSSPWLRQAACAQ
jgi:LysR family carnitine catabolism transcriptional activator